MDYDYPEQEGLLKDLSNYKLLNGVPGSLKTETLVKQVIYDILYLEAITKEKYIVIKKTKYGNKATFTLNTLKEKHFKRFHGCINTLTNSVTEEIKNRLSFYLNIDFEKRNSHYIYSNDYISINISSMDGFIHTQLSSYKCPILEEKGDYYNLKADQLTKDINNGVIKEIVTKLQDTCTHIYSDEFQDMRNDRCLLLIKICLNIPSIRMNIYGDILQTIYTHSIRENCNHPMIEWRNEVNAKEYKTNKCFRCPPSHLRLLEKILSQEIFPNNSVYESYNVPIAISMKEEKENRIPILFTHPSTSNNQDADIIASQIKSSIKCLMDYDKEVLPGDICILMKKCNGNHTFHKIYNRLNELYKTKGFIDKIKIFETRGDGSHHRIDWDDITNADGDPIKTVMLSIHGDKGKGHRVVYFIGLSEKSLPMDIHIYKDEEITEISALNVGLSRSTDYLFIGFNNKLPSRYIKDILEEVKVDKYAICSWDNKKNIPDGFYKDNINALLKPWRDKKPDLHKFPKPLFSLGNELAYKEQPVYMPIDENISISKIYEELTEPERIINLKKEIIFETDIKCDWNITDEHLQPIIGIFGELLYTREHYYRICIPGLFEQELNTSLNFIDFIMNDRIYYTNNNELMNIVYDNKLNLKGIKLQGNHKDYKEIMNKHKNNKELVKDIGNYLSEDKRVILPCAFNSDKIRKSLKEFIKYKPSNKLLIDDIWNISLIQSIINDEIYRPCLNVWLNNSPIRCIKNLLINIKLIQDKLDITEINDVDYQSNHSLKRIITDKKLIKRIGKEGNTSLSFGIVGRSDMIDIRNKVLYDIKTPFNDSFNNGWVSQVIGYLLTPVRSSKIDMNRFITWNKGGIIDITNGCVYQLTFDFESVNKQIILNHILEIHNFDSEVIEYFNGYMNEY